MLANTGYCWNAGCLTSSLNTSSGASTGEETEWIPCLQYHCQIGKYAEHIVRRLNNYFDGGGGGLLRWTQKCWLCVFFAFLFKLLAHFSAQSSDAVQHGGMIFYRLLVCSLYTWLRLWQPLGKNLKVANVDMDCWTCLVESLDEATANRIA